MDINNTSYTSEGYRERSVIKSTFPLSIRLYILVYYLNRFELEVYIYLCT